MAFRKEKREQQEIALERIVRLFQLAEKEAFAGEDELAESHVRLARSVGTRYNVRIPKGFRGKYCKGCSTYFTPKNHRTRINSRDKRVEVRCGKCGKVMGRNYK